MTTAKKNTIKIIKEQRTVSEQAKERRKTYADIRKRLLKALEEGPMTIPELAGETGLSAHEVTYYLMTLRKYGEVVTGEVDDDDEYYYYELKKQATE
jgi:predicted Rossmann fold nucleotide-binding protein DprA/Smf involved in DNA uptake